MLSKKIGYFGFKFLELFFSFLAVQLNLRLSLFLGLLQPACFPCEDLLRHL